MWYHEVLHAFELAQEQVDFRGASRILFESESIVVIYDTPLLFHDTASIEEYLRSNAAAVSKKQWLIRITNGAEPRAIMKALCQSRRFVTVPCAQYNALHEAFQGVTCQKCCKLFVTPEVCKQHKLDHDLHDEEEQKQPSPSASLMKRKAPQTPVDPTLFKYFKRCDRAEEEQAREPNKYQRHGMDSADQCEHGSHDCKPIDHLAMHRGKTDNGVAQQSVDQPVFHAQRRHHEHSQVAVNTFLAHPGHRALAALCTVSQQINMNIKRETMETAKALSGDNGTKATRAMIKAIRSIPDFEVEKDVRAIYAHIYPVCHGWNVTTSAGQRLFIPHVHVDWAIVAKALPQTRHLVSVNGYDSEDDDSEYVKIRWDIVNSQYFRADRPMVHGGGYGNGGAFSMLDTGEPEPCYFKPFNDPSIDHLANLETLIANFDVVYVKHDRDFKLPEDSFCCLYQWPQSKEYENWVLLRDAYGQYVTELDDPRFVVVLRKTVPVGYFHECTDH